MNTSYKKCNAREKSRSTQHECLTCDGRRRLFVRCVDVGAGAQARVDRKAAESAIVKADREFCQALIDREPRSLSLLRGRRYDVFRRSRAAPRQGCGGPGLGAVLQRGGPTVTWKPIKADVLVGGDVGYTVGTWERRTPDADGKLAITHGDYLTVWEKQTDGAWKVVFDTGSSAPSNEVKRQKEWTSAFCLPLLPFPRSIITLWPTLRHRKRN